MNILKHFRSILVLAKGLPAIKIPFSPFLPNLSQRSFKQSLYSLIIWFFYEVQASRVGYQLNELRRQAISQYLNAY